MTQPPTDPPTGRPDYPRQELLPQQVRQRRSRTPWLVAAVVLVVAVVGGVVAWQLTSGGGSGDRAAYCQQVRQLSSGGRGGSLGNLDGAGSADRLLARLESIRAVAPSPVRPAWADLLQVISRTAGGRPSGVDVLGAMNDLQTIVADANRNCGTHIHLNF